MRRSGSTLTFLGSPVWRPRGERTPECWARILNIDVKRGNSHKKTKRKPTRLKFPTPKLRIFLKVLITTLSCVSEDKLTSCLTLPFCSATVSGVEAQIRDSFFRQVLQWEFLAASGVWKIALRLGFPDEGIAVNSWNVPVKINNAALAVSPRFPLFNSFFWGGVGVNQTNVSSRSQALQIPARRVPSFNPLSGKHAFKVKLQQLVRVGSGSY